MNNIIKETKIEKNKISIDSLISTFNNLINIQNPINEIKNVIIETNIPSDENYKNYILSKNIDNLFSKITSSKKINNKFIQLLEYINKLISEERNIDFNKFKSIKYQQKEINQKITILCIYIIKYNINKNQNILNQNLFRYIILMIYSNIFSVDNFILVINLFLNLGINIIKKEEIIIENNPAFKKSPISFINDLFKTLNNIPKKYINIQIHIKLINELITLLDKNIFSSPYNIHLNKLDVWMKLLGNRIFQIDNNFICYNKIMSFLVKIYKCSFKSLFLYRYIYEKSAISFDYYINSLDFLCLLFKEEQNKRYNNDFKIKNGFYIYNNIPLILNNIQFKTNYYSFIFSFKLEKISNDKEDVILLNLVNNENMPTLIFAISQPNNILKIIGPRNIEWNTNLIIELNKDYLISLNQEKKTLTKKINLYINKNKNDNKNSLEYDHLACNLIDFPDFSQPLLLELGKSNFEGIFGDLFILNKKISSKEIMHLYNLKEDYSDIISSINYLDHFTNEKKKYGYDDIKLNYFKNLKYQCFLKILSKEISNLLPNQYLLSKKPYGELKYSKNNNNISTISNVNNNINIQIYHEIYSINFFHEYNGIEYLIFQLHKIKSLAEDKKYFNFYLYKTLYFLLEYIKLEEKIIFANNNDNKIELNFYNFFLTLITILNTKKSKIELEENFRELLLDFNKIFQDKKCFDLQKMNFNILLDKQLFKNNDIKNYNKLFDAMIWHLNNNSNDNTYLIFYKILLFDDIFDIKSKEIKHRKYMEIISKLISVNKKIKVKNHINECLIGYFINIKSIHKIYHYLKIIYYQINSLKDIYKENSEFINYIITNFNKLDNYDCKYCSNIQILCFLLYDIIVNNTDEKNGVFGYSPFGFMKSPNYKFIRCIFIQCFKLENKHKLKFIKFALNYDNEIDIINKILRVEKINILSLIDFEFFIPKLNGIIKYYCFLYNEYLTQRNINILILLKKSIKLILDFLDKIVKIEDFNSKNDLTEKNPTNEFIKKLFTCSCIKLLFILYFNVFNEQELKDFKNIEKYILFSINTIYNPFYFYLLLPFIDLNSDNYLNKYYKTEIFNKIISNIILANNTLKISINNGNIKNNSNNILLLNSIIILIKIYNIINNNDKSVSIFKAEKYINIYIKFILDNNFFYSKYIFNINLVNENVIKNEQNQNNNNNNKIKEKENKKKQILDKEKEKEKEKEKINKFLAEITLDIIFQILSKKEDLDLINLLHNNLIKENNSFFYEIDDYFLSESNYNKNMDTYNNSIIQILNNQNINTNYCNGTNTNSIIFSLYFFIYFFYKQKDFSKNLNINDKNESGSKLTNLIDKVLEILFKDIMCIYQKYIKKIKKIKSKVVFNEVICKVYYILFDHFLSKYKDNTFHFKESIDLFAYFQNYLKNSKEMHKNNKIEKRPGFKTSMKDLNIFNFSLDDDKNESSKNNVNNSNTKSRKISNITQEDSLLIQINNKEIKNINYNRNRIKRSLTISKEKIIKHNIKDIEDNSSYETTSFISKLRTPKLKNKESKKNLDTDISSITTSVYINNIEISSETNSESSFYDNNLFINSNYNCNNFTEEKRRKRKNAFYLNSKNFTSAICLKPNKLSSNDVLNDLDISDFSYFDEKVKNNKLSEDNTRYKSNANLDKITINLSININDSIIEEKNNNIDDIDEMSSSINENENNHQYLITRLKENNIPKHFFKKIAKKDEPKWLRIVLNPKREIMRIFGFVFRKFIYKNKKFIKLKNTFNIHFKNITLESSIPDDKNYSLNYATKLKNYTCSDYYRPFLKPILNYFNTEYFFNAHKFLKKEIVKKDKCEEEILSRINFEKILLIIKNKKTDYRIKCENLSNKGSIYGAIYLHHSLMFFQDFSKSDPRSSKEKDSDKLFYLFSSDVADRLKEKNKTIIIYYNEIKEIILRRYCFTDIAYEIFMKDNRSYFFNFFEKENREKFYDSLMKKINNRNKKLKEESKSNELYYKDNKISFSFIKDPKFHFEKKDIKSLYIKKEITNFQYLLLVNKFSTRTYNDTCQYLIFPLLYMDLEQKKERDLSKAICLNKKLTEDDYVKYENNYETMGFHFNNHYSTMAYVIFYLMRLIPFTNCQIKFQSGHFDSPSRMFTSLDNLLYVFSISDENRELLPEFFYFYESFLNLNYNDFGFIQTDKKQIHHFNTSTNCGIVEFIINLRNILEKKEISPWINIIFGCKQLNDNYESLNGFPSYSYEQYNNFEKQKEEIIEEKNKNPKIINEKIHSIRSKIQLLSLGLTPAQLFKGPHPNRENKETKKSNNNINRDISFVEVEKKNSSKKRILNYATNRSLKNFISKENFKNLLFSFNNINTENIKIIFVFENQIKIFNYLSENDKDQPQINIDLEEDITLLKIKPYRNIFIELCENIFLFCRLINRTLLLCSEKKKYYIEWPCIITSIEFYSHSKFILNQYSEYHINRIIIGDEDGYLSIIEIIIEFYDKKKEFIIKKLNSIIKRNKFHYSYINGIKYNQRLNIIISSCAKGYITINNAYSFEIINIINIGKNYNILDFKISEYDLLYIYTNIKNKNDEYIYELYCYTINGIKIKKLNLKECINFYINNKSIYILYKDGNIGEYNCSNFKEINNHINKEEIKDITNYGDAIHCVYYSKISKLFIIFNKKYKNILISNKW